MAAAAALHPSLAARNPNHVSHCQGTLAAPRPFAPPPISCRFGDSRVLTYAVASGSSHLWMQSSVRQRRLQTVASAAPGENSPKEIELGDEKKEIEVDKDDSEEAWVQLLVSFREQAQNIQSASEEAYRVFLVKAMAVLQEASKTLKIQTVRARSDLLEIVKETSEEGKVYLSVAAQNSPDSLKDILETLSSLPRKLNDIPNLNDFSLGIPYGVLLSAGGFASFMFTGSLSAVRFGVILGTTLLALSLSSLRAWREGQSSSIFLKGQTVIATLIFVRECRMLGQRPSLATLLMAAISGSMLVFYASRIIRNGKEKRGST